ncbi:esterase/lipase family protein [Tichowtungia aerotolerans]|uniref:DUF676 domain-containing protein n=1 Tax=Tichowtungia aerotolerans TaxID=2697043 RepID=A0A6P1MBW2_9BACT|nr:hypothetical protein [Tichowtungia aerotolerans]QHI68585.1 hypothetical protein GT409_03680 [Tichowtungia aerotolerans]
MGKIATKFERGQLIILLVTLTGYFSSMAAGINPTNMPLASWVDLDQFTGAPESSAITRTDYRQLVYELQQQRQQAAVEQSQAFGALKESDVLVYEQVAAPRNNEWHKVALSLIHWDRTVVSATAGVAMQDESVQVESVESNVTVFAFSPLKDATYRGSYLEVVLDESDLFEEVSSSEQQISEIYLDGGDGQGAQSVNLGQPIVLSYESTGEKTLSIKATLAGGTVLYAESALDVIALSTPLPTQTVRVQADDPYSDFQGNLYVYKSGSHTGLNCPVFVVEGFDMNNDMDWDVLYNILNKESLVETLRAYGRDLVVLDFDDATADIFGNAYLAIEAIQYINSSRRSSSDKFTVIGASMGGLVTRRALAAMDKYPYSYGYSDVNTWISFDSPQTGANIPLGVQNYFDFFGGFAGSYSQLAVAREYRDKIDSVAAQQMLLCHYRCTDSLAGESPYYSESFWNSMNSYGYPTSCKTIAISNGSGYGTKQPFYPGQQVIQWHYDDGVTLEIGSRIYALYRSDSTALTDFYGRFDPWDLFDLVDETVYERNFYPYGLDNASGGTRSTFQDLFDELPYKSSDDWCNYGNHCFIPTCSSLGIPISKIEQTIHGNSSVLSLSPFDEVHYASTNEKHIDVNSNNKRWFLRAILEGYDTDRDGFDDYQEHYLGTAYNNALSKLTLSTGLSVPSQNSVAVSWLAYPNTKNYVYRAETLNGPWQLVNTITASSSKTITRTYAISDELSCAFFNVTAKPVDPIQD